MAELIVLVEITENVIYFERQEDTFLSGESSNEREPSILW